MKYLKCVKSDTKHFTENARYLIEGQDEWGCYDVVANNGQEMNVPLVGNVWEFEVVEGASHEQPKLTPRSLGCFQQVADVIGDESAERELQKVIDYPDNDIGDDTDKYLLDCFAWDYTPQGFDFWSDVYDGKIPEELQTNQTSTNSDNSSDKSEPKSAPVFGDLLHICGEPYVFVKSTRDGYFVTVNRHGVVRECDAEVFDEYMPDETQELRNRILKRWRGQSLDHSFDTVVCRADVSVGDIVEFVVENLNAEFQD